MENHRPFGIENCRTTKYETNSRICRILQSNRTCLFISCPTNNENHHLLRPVEEKTREADLSLIQHEIVAKETFIMT